MRPGSPRHPAFGIAVLALLAGGQVRASSTFPQEIRVQLALGYTPDCTLCHAGAPGIGTAITPFATSMRARGLVAGSLPSLDTALAALEAEMTDSDHDGVPDIEELKASTDPNAAGASLAQPTYGCFNVVGRPPGAAATLAALLAVMLAGRRRRTRR